MKWKWTWLIALLPAGVGIVAAVLLSIGRWENPIAFVRADLSTWALLLGTIASILVAAGIAFYEWGMWMSVSAQTRSADDRRRFIRRLDHELKNPLTAIRAGLANLDDSADMQTWRQSLESIQVQVLRLSRLSADLRKLAELEIRPVERAPVDLGELLRDVYNLAQDQPGAKERKMLLTIPHAPWPLPKISGDRDLIFLAVHNLLDNAVKFTRPEDTIEVRAFEDASSIVMEVADTGPGIPPEEIPHVWEELYRGQGARGIPGSGLGLALVRAVAERHGGRVTLRSRIGQGTVLTLRLPQG